MSDINETVSPVSDSERQWLNPSVNGLIEQLHSRIAEKDVEIARLKAELQNWLNGFTVTHGDDIRLTVSPGIVWSGIKSLRTALEQTPCTCICDEGRRVESLITSEQRGMFAHRVVCGDLPDEQHPNRVWCARCMALGLDKVTT